MMNDFVVSARKYRPATFHSVVGQEHITSTLRNAIERGQLAHAYLFCGPRGVGKTTCARIFAKAINCLQPEGAEACNVCESCRSFDEGRSLNIHELDAASNNSVEDIRTLIEQVRIVPQVGRYAVFIIDEVHMLSSAAFNAFLKTLEEPPAHAIFILATTEKHKIIPTILSRCQIYDFNRIRVEDAVGYLRHIASQEGIATDDQSLNLIARKADGGMRDALSMFDKAVSFCGTELDYHAVAQTLNVLDYDTYFGIVRTLLGGDYVGALLAFDDVLARGFSGQTFLAGLNRHLRDLLVARNPATLPLLEVAGTLSERYRDQAALCTTEFLYGAMGLLTEADGRLRQSSNQRLLVELTLMKLAAPGQKKNNPPAGSTLPELNGPARQTTSSAVAPPSRTPSEALPTPEQAATETVTAAAAPPAPARPARPAEHPAETERPTAPEATRAADVPDNCSVSPDGPVPAQDSHSVPSHNGQPQGARTTALADGQAAPDAIHSAASEPAPTVKPGRIGPSLTELQTPDAPVNADRDEPTPAAFGSTSLTASGPKQTPEHTSPDPQPGPITDPETEHQPASAPDDKPGTTRRIAPRAPLVSGASITELIQALPESGEPDDEEPQTGETPETDPESDRKLEAARQQILALIQQKRPRFVAAFEQMAFDDGVILVAVPSTALRDEILRSKTSMLLRIAEVAGVHGKLDLRITVNEAIRAARPIKLEDRMKHLMEKNPVLAELRKALDLEAE